MPCMYQPITFIWKNRSTRLDLSREYYLPAPICPESTVIDALGSS